MEANLAGATIVGVGLRYMGLGDVPNGIEAFGQYPLTTAIAVEVGAAARVVEPVVPSQENLIYIAYQGDPDTTFQCPIPNDLAVVALNGEFTPFPVLRTKSLSGGMHVRAGVEFAAVEQQLLTLSSDYKAGNSQFPAARSASPAMTFAVGPAIGFAADAYAGKRFGLRFKGGLRWTMSPEPDYGNIDPTTGQMSELKDVITTTASWAIDFVVAL